MSLERELRSVMGRFVRGELPLSALRDWLQDHVHDVADTDDPLLEDLDNSAWLLISEHDRGHLDEEQLRLRLADTAGIARQLPFAGRSHLGSR